MGRPGEAVTEGSDEESAGDEEGAEGVDDGKIPAGFHHTGDEDGKIDVSSSNTYKNSVSGNESKSGSVYDVQNSKYILYITIL